VLAFLGITYLALIQVNVTENQNVYLDKFFHALAFFVLIWLVHLSSNSPLRWWMIFSLIFYGIFLEVFQSYLPTRTAEVLDVLANLAGMLVYFFLAPMFIKEEKR